MMPCSPWPSPAQEGASRGTAKSAASGVPLLIPRDYSFSSFSLTDLSPHPSVSPPCRPSPAMSSPVAVHGTSSLPSLAVSSSPTNPTSAPHSVHVQPCVRPRRSAAPRCRRGHGRPCMPRRAWIGHTPPCKCRVPS
ncbi:hypothetical protein PVAP13_8KG310000 [Panicum virgatum]|uniref:Uncharacterized protein n=1 Tax=Panicum virgatum TaxID=38727 RepID=A0A8T0PQ96_PANVG|nr:hypothetical protein PVAP13_8KG310000 [Panicum virgatum]